MTKTSKILIAAVVVLILGIIFSVYSANLLGTP